MSGRPSWDPCQCCDGQGCPWCKPERYGLPPRDKSKTPPRQQETPRPPSLQDLIALFGGYHKITPEGWAQYDDAMGAYRERYLESLFNRPHAGTTREK